MVVSSRSAPRATASATEWYFQRYVEHLPAAGEMMLFDRSWYNRAGVERVMGFATEAEVAEFMRSCPEFEGMLLRSGHHARQVLVLGQRRGAGEAVPGPTDDPTKRWKLSPMDIESRNRWEDYSYAKDEMFAHTDTIGAPWWVVNADDKRNARLNCIAHLLVVVPVPRRHGERSRSFRRGRRGSGSTSGLRTSFSGSSPRSTESRARRARVGRFLRIRYGRAPQHERKDRSRARGRSASAAAVRVQPD